ncbi:MULTISPECIES: glycine cleavage system protein H [unclassified Crossiella]|uniref:glycine cleavage system protein H n=1 Tax=unclassified Crossiella TaxID=2620835 RepID=UPI001FFF8607|nr:MULTISPECIES: glycine cleavage system protein H [unclassified Crossiella]MCK2239556.1 glycine cleavage system protein H [Crossiella sp. S99.2]MCK2252251.1 glycine cleavage system protein H [Crossiella sp. S99.1]
MAVKDLYQELADVPDKFDYTADHAWIEFGEDTVKLGLTAPASRCLGTVRYLSLPPRGARLEAGERCGLIASIRLCSDLFAPVSGEVVEVNTEVLDDPSLLLCSNDSDVSWLVKVRLTAWPEHVLTPEEYRECVDAAYPSHRKD